MKTLIVAATEAEIKPLITTQDSELDFLITGVGTPACMYEIARKTDINAYKLIINAGIAGSFTPQLKIGDVVIVNSDQFGDVGIGEEEHFKPIKQTPFSNNCYSKLQNNFCPKELEHLTQATAITVNSSCYHSTLANNRKEMFGGEIESMEGAAFFLMMKNITPPYLQIRSISNHAGESNKSKWNIPLAIENLNNEILAFLNVYQTKKY